MCVDLGHVIANDKECITHERGKTGLIIIATLADVCLSLMVHMCTSAGLCAKSYRWLPGQLAVLCSVAYACFLVRQHTSLLVLRCLQCLREGMGGLNLVAMLSELQL